MNNKIIYVTGNWAKLASAKQFLEPLGFEIDNIKMDTIEIQADNVEEVAKYSAVWASNKVKCDVLKNDTGLHIEALNGFPGVYTKYVEDTIGEDGILKLLECVENRKAYFKEVLAFCPYGGEPVTFVGVTKGTIAKEKSGTFGWSWDFIFIPEGETKTLACFPDEERWNFWSKSSYENLAKYLNNKKELNLELYIPKLEDYWYEEKIQSDPNTMNYNAGYDVSYYGYNYDTGCISFHKEKWEETYKKRQDKNIFFAYLKHGDIFVGYVNYHYNKLDDIYECGIVIESIHRGKGYSKKGLKLLCDKAKENGIKELYDTFEKDRTTSLKVFESVGFEMVKEIKLKKFGKEVCGVVLKKIL